MEDQKKESLWERLQYKYRLSISNDDTFKEVFSMRLSRLNVYAVVGTSILCIIGLVTTLFLFTPLKELIPGYPNGEMRREILTNAIKLDSLELEIEKRDKYFKTLNAIIAGKEPESYDKGIDTNVNYNDIKFTTSIHDSILRQQIEKEEQYNLSLLDSKKSGEFSSLHFFSPVKGIITNSFNASENHFGTDIVANPNDVVKAVLDGTIIMADWTLETGYVIQIQHENNLLSIYKHNAELLKSVGGYVKAGDAIAIIGNSGELTTGPHLHFEIWHNGLALNPEDYIVF